MKNKLIGFFVCMLIFISMSPTTSVTTLQSDEKFQDLTIKATGTNPPQWLASFYPSFQHVENILVQNQPFQNKKPWIPSGLSSLSKTIKSPYPANKAEISFSNTKGTNVLNFFVISYYGTYLSDNVNHELQDPLSGQAK